MVEVTSSVWALNSPDWISWVAVTLSSTVVISIRASFGVGPKKFGFGANTTLPASKPRLVIWNGPEMIAPFCGAYQSCTKLGLATFSTCSPAAITSRALAP